MAIHPNRFGTGSTCATEEPYFNNWPISFAGLSGNQRSQGECYLLTVPEEPYFNNWSISFAGLSGNQRSQGECYLLTVP